MISDKDPPIKCLLCARWMRVVPTIGVHQFRAAKPNADVCVECLNRDSGAIVAKRAAELRLLSLKASGFKPAKTANKQKTRKRNQREKRVREDAHSLFDMAHLDRVEMDVIYRGETEEEEDLG